MSSRPVEDFRTVAELCQHLLHVFNLQHSALRFGVGRRGAFHGHDVDALVHNVLRCQRLQLQLIERLMRLLQKGND